MNTNKSQIPSLILLRGLPGSGKTTLANLLSENNKYPLFSVDDYFTNKDNGDYHFEFSENHIAYKQCEENTRKAILEGHLKVILHNTFMFDWEMEPYFKIAAKLACSIYIVTVENYHQHKNTHAITDEQIKKMGQKYKVKLY